MTARKKFGEEQVHIWRRSYDIPPPGGESLKLTADRTLPYYEAEILPRIKKGEKVLVAAHGNSLRAIIKSLEGLSGEEIVNVELATGVPIVYKLDAEGKVVSKEILSEFDFLAVTSLPSAINHCPFFPCRALNVFSSR